MLFNFNGVKNEFVFGLKRRHEGLRFIVHFLISLLFILPLIVLGRLSTNSMIRGYL